MGFKDLFKLSWPIFILFVIFNFFASIGLFTLSGIGGKAVGSGIFNIFSFFIQFKCASAAGIQCMVWDPLLNLIVFVLNVLWQLFLANLVVFVYHKIRKQ